MRAIASGRAAMFYGLDDKYYDKYYGRDYDKWEGPPPGPAAYEATTGPAEDLSDDEGYSMMAQEFLDDGGAVGAVHAESPLAPWPSGVSEEQAEPTEVESAVSAGFRNSHGSPRESASVLSEETAFSDGVPPRGGPARAVPGAVSSGGGVGGRLDPVIFSCFAPPAVRPGTSFDLRVRAYLRRMRDAVLREALSEGAAEAGGAEGMSIPKGARVSVRLVRMFFERKRQKARGKHDENKK